jgi:hypothetical protein
MVYFVVFRMKIYIRITKKVCTYSYLKKKYFDSLSLKQLGLYVNLLDPFVAYSQPFNFVYK